MKETTDPGDYVIPTNQQAMRAAMDELQLWACIHFVPRTTEPNYLLIQNSATNSSEGVGMIGGVQAINIFNWNYMYLMCHELMHALGFWHEHQRPDRDQYVAINFANIIPAQQYAFQIAAGAIVYGPYDFDSVMHYDQFAYSSNGSPTITVLPPNQIGWQNRIGQRTHLSRGDWLGLQLTYGSTAQAGYYRFEEGTPNTPATGPLFDCSPLTNNGVPVGGPLYRADVPISFIPATGLPNQLSLEFDGVDDAVFVNAQFPFHQPGDVTVEFWLRFQAVSTQYAPSILWTRSDSNDTDRFNFFVNDKTSGTFGFDYRSPSGVLHPLIDQEPIPSDTWTHLAITRAGNTYSLYVNGQLKRSAVDLAPDLPTSLGWHMSGRSRYMFQGKLDEVRLWLGALLPGQFLVDPGFVVNYGTGCPGTGGLTPQIAPKGLLQIGQAISIDVTNALGGSQGLLLLGTTRASIPFGGCRILVTSIAYVPLTLNGSGAGAGSASLRLTIPANPTLIGFVLDAQAVVVDPGAGIGLAFTQGLEITIGP